MIVKIDKILESQGKSRNWLSEETGIMYKTLCRLCNGQTTSISFDVVEKICSVLNCSITDILEPEHIEINRQIVYQSKAAKSLM